MEREESEKEDGVGAVDSSLARTLGIYLAMVVALRFSPTGRAQGWVEIRCLLCLLCLAPLNPRLPGLPI